MAGELPEGFELEPSAPEKQPEQKVAPSQSELPSGFQLEGTAPVAEPSWRNAVEAFGSQYLNTALLNAPRNIRAGIGSYIHGVPFEQEFQRIKAKEEAAQRAYPKLATAGEIAGIGAGMATLPGGAAGKLTAEAAPSILGRVGRGALTGAGYGAAAGALGEHDIGATLTGGLTGGAAGAVLGPVAEKAAEAIGKRAATARGALSGVEPTTGAFTPEAQRAIQEAGIAPQDVSALEPHLKQVFAEKAPSPEAAREAAAAEFGVPLSRGETTLDPNELYRESKLPTAGEFGEFKGQQAEAIEAAREGLIHPPGAATQYEHPTDALSDVLDNLRQTAASRKSEYKQAYDEAYGKQGVFDPQAVRTISPAIKSAMRDEGFVVTPELAPKATTALNIIDRDLGNLGLWNRLASDKPPTVSQVDQVTMKQIETVRKTLNNIYRGAKDPTDRAALGNMIGKFDDHVHGMVQDGLFYGEPDTLEAMKKARGLFANYQKTFGKRSGDAAANAIDDLIAKDGNVTNLANYFLNNGTLNGQIGTKAVSVPLYEKLENALGAGSEGMEQLRTALKLKLLTPTQKVNQDPYKEAQDVAKRVQQFLSGSGKPLAERAFTPEELGVFRRYAAVLQNATRRGKEDISLRQDNKWLKDLAWRTAEAVGVGTAVATHGIGGLLTTAAIPVVDWMRKGLANRAAAKIAHTAAQGAPQLTYRGPQLPIITPQREQRASGGRIEDAAARLEREAARVGRQLGGALEGLTRIPDETIASALRLARHGV